MSPEKAEGRSKAQGPALHELARWVVRAWLSLFSGHVRVLGADRMPQSAAILHVCHGPSFADALLLTAASPRRVTCLVPRRELSFLQSLLASSLGMVCYDLEPTRWHAALQRCTQVLASGGVLAEFRVPDESQPTRQSTPSTLAHEAWSGAFPDVIARGQPVYRFRPPGRGHEILIHIGEPTSLNELEASWASSPESRSFSQERCGENIFMMEPPILNRSLREFEEVLRDQLQEQWAGTSARRQSVDGFRLSPGAAETLRLMNCAEPEVLLELRQLLQAERETRRECSLAQSRADLGRKQFSSMWRALAWAETLVGFPIACYAVLNHLVIGLVLAGFNLAWGQKRAHVALWSVRASIVLACYVGQIVLADHLLGRATAGYYAVTLPLSGAYLWRYRWLLRRRTRILLLGAKASTLEKRADKNRKRLLRRLRAILDAGLTRPRAVDS